MCKLLHLQIPPLLEKDNSKINPVNITQTSMSAHRVQKFQNKKKRRTFAALLLSEDRKVDLRPLRWAEVHDVDAAVHTDSVR